MDDERAPLVDSSAASSDGEGFGQKTIGTIPGCMLIINNATGSGIPLLPLVYQQAGWFSVTLCLLLVAAFTGFAATMLVEAMKLYPGNRSFGKRVEYATLAKHFLGRRLYILTQVLLNLSLLSMNLVSMLQTIQIMDWLLVRIFGCTCGLTFWPELAAKCVCPPVGTCVHQDSPFGHAMVLGTGYLLSIALVVPLAFFNLDDNIGVQMACTMIQSGIFLYWVASFVSRGFVSSAVSAVGSDQSSVLGQVMVNFAFVLTVPSWCNEKRRSSSVNVTIWSAVFFSTLIYLLIGLMGAYSFPDLRGSDILTALNRQDATLFDQISVYLFPIIVVASGIPVYSIIVRYNLVQNGIAKRGMANFLAIVLPWLLVVPLTAGNNVFNELSNFTALAFQMPVNLILPFVIYYVAIRQQHTLKGCMCPKDEPCAHDAASANRDAAESESETSHDAICFSRKHPLLARVLPKRVVKAFDHEFKPASEHFALPKRLPWRVLLAIAVGCAIVCTVFLALAFALSIYVVIEASIGSNTTALNVTNSTC